jgi:rare lipoprotein A
MQTHKAEADTNLKLIECGEASFYGAELAGNRTASGELFQPKELTAAHKTLEFGTIVTVVAGKHLPDSAAARTVQVRINDRGPFAAGRIIDLSSAAFTQLASQDNGILDVCIYTKP